MSKLYFIPVSGDAVEVPPEQYGKLEYACPSFEFMRPNIPCDTIEHLNVRFNGGRAHLFFDEEGLLKGKSPNPRATAIFANAQLARTVRGGSLAYNDLNEVPPSPIVLYSAYGTLIVGNAYLWTGDME